MSNKVLVKLYDKDETFIATLSWANLSSFPSFDETFGYGHWKLSFEYAVDYDDTTIDHYDIITVETTDGTVIYKWVVVWLKRILENVGEKILVTCMGMLSLGKKALYYNWSTYTFTKTDDPRDIIEDIIDYINSKYTTNPFSYTTNTTTIAWGTTISIDFDYTDCVEAIKKIVELTNYVFRIDGDGTVYFTPTTTTYVADHLLTMGKHIERIEIDEESDELYNDYILEYTGWSTQTGSDATSITAYGTLTEYINDASVQNSATATERIDWELSKYKNPRLNTKIIVNDNYSIETLKVWDLISIQNMEYSLTDKVIQKVQYNTTYAVVYIDGYNSIERSLRKIL